MKHKFTGQVYVFLLIVLLITLTAGCAPTEYTDGVRYRDFPDDVLPVYDDAIVFDFENDDDVDFDLSAGTKDDMDDVAEFYQDYFDDEAITLTAEEEDDGEYTAEGVYEGYEFELKVKEPRGEWEKKLYKAVIEIELKIAEAAATPAPSAAPGTTPAPETTQGSTATPAPDKSADILGKWYLYDMKENGQSQYGIPDSFYFYEDKTGLYELNSQWDSDTISFKWEIVETSLIIYWDNGEGEARQYTVDGEFLVMTFSQDDYQYVITYSRNEPDPDPEPVDAAMPFTGAWIVTEGDRSFSMSCSFWADGYGWFWWTNPDGTEVTLSTTWEYDQENAVIQFYDQDDSAYTYNVVCDGSALTLYDDSNSFAFDRADGYLLEGAWYLMGYVDDYGNETEDYSFGITLIADGTGSRYDLDAQDQRYNEEPLSWYLNEYGNIVLNIGGESIEARYNLEVLELSMSMYYTPYDLYATYWFGIMGG